MKRIEMVDLKGQYVKIKHEIDSAIQGVINSSAFINGAEVNNLKQKLANYLSSKHVVTCANGTDALQISLMALELQEGDEVILPDFTFIATAEVVALLKLKPVFVDVDQHTFNMDVIRLKEAINDRTRVIIPVHLFGQCANMTEIVKIAKKNKLYVIEDNAQAFGAEMLFEGDWKKAGTIGDIACTSFFPSKNLGCFGDGGAIMTNNDKIGKDIAAIANHGAKVKYYHDMVGVNSRLDTIQAAILLVKLKYIDEYNKQRQQAAYAYDQLLKDVPQISTPQKVEYSSHVYHQYTIKAEERDELRSYLAGKNIPSMIYYPVGMHNQKAYKSEGRYKVTDALCESVLALPMHTELECEQQDYIAKSIIEFYA